MKIIYYSALCLLLLCSCNDNEAGKTANTTPAATKPDSVAVFIAKRDSVEKTVTLPGELLPYQQVEIRAKVQGYLKKVNVDIGSVVHKGQLLALIDAPEINSRASEGSEKIQSARAKYLASKDSYDRIHIASQTDGVIAATELEKAKNVFMADSADYKAALYNASTYRQMGNYLAITAPFSGVITKRNVNEGAYVGTPAEQPLLVLEDISTLRLRVAVPEAYAGAKLKSGTIKFTTKALPEKAFDGKLVRKSESIDNGSRSEIWEFEAPNPNKLLKAGMYTDARLVLQRTQPSFTVPPSAVVTTQERRFVIKIQAGKTTWVDVSQGLNLGDKIEIFGNLTPGDTLATKANEEMKPGTAVRTKL